MVERVKRELGKSYVVVFCKGCGAGYRVRQEPVEHGKPHGITKAETHACPACKHMATYEPAEIRVGRFQKEGLGRHKKAQ